MFSSVYTAYTVFSLGIAMVVSFRAVTRVKQNGHWMPESGLLQAIVGFSLAGLILFALSSVFDYFALYMYIREMSMRLAPQMSSQTIMWHIARTAIITLAYIIVLVYGRHFDVKGKLVESFWDKVTWVLLLLGVGRMAAEPLLLVVQIVQQSMRVGQGM